MGSNKRISKRERASVLPPVDLTAIPDTDDSRTARCSAASRYTVARFVAGIVQC